uniref:C-type lectin domain-containing protein n=1 Tax=Spermophilus dauricus TaxID=99837 RepID=A0A8C9QMT5_SPEDA
MNAASANTSCASTDHRARIKILPALAQTSCSSPQVLGSIWSVASPSFTVFTYLNLTLREQLECQSYGNGAHLASILNLKEASVIAEYISGYQRTQPVWIGLHDPQKKQQWQWIDGASYLYRPWSGRSLGGNKHCTEMDFVTWNKNECSKRQHFLCKYRP